MSHISTLQLSEMAGITKRHCQRLLIAGRVPDAVRTDGGHWLIPDNAKLRKWIAKQKNEKHTRKVASVVYSSPVIPNKKTKVTKLTVGNEIHKCQQNLKTAGAVMTNAIDSARANAHAAGLLLIAAYNENPGGKWLPWLSANGVDKNEAKDLMNFAKWCERPRNQYSDVLMLKKFGIIRASKNDDQNIETDWRDKKDKLKPQWPVWAGKLCGFVNVTTKQRAVYEWSDTEKEAVRLTLKPIADFYQKLSR
jgi:hypothetical protein